MGLCNFIKLQLWEQYRLRPDLNGDTGRGRRAYPMSKSNWAAVHEHQVGYKRLALLLWSLQKLHETVKNLLRSSTRKLLSQVFCILLGKLMSFPALNQRVNNKVEMGNT